MPEERDSVVFRKGRPQNLFCFGKTFTKLTKTYENSWNARGSLL